MPEAFHANAIVNVRVGSVSTEAADDTLNEAQLVKSVGPGTAASCDADLQPRQG